MRFGFLNNFADLLAAPVSDTATSIELAGKASDIQTALQSVDAVALTLFATDDQGNETQREVVYATAAAPPLVTVTRAQEGTTAVAFAPGDGCQGRLTAGVLSSVWFNSEIQGAYTLSSGYNAKATKDNALAIGGSAWADGFQSVAIGSGFNPNLADTEAENNFNYGAYAAGINSVALGTGAKALADDCFALGIGAKTEKRQSVAIGPKAFISGERSTAINTNWNVEGDYCVAMGWWSLIGYNALPLDAVVDRSIAIGPSATIGSQQCTVIGQHAFADENAQSSVAIGPSARTSVESGLRINAVPYLSANPDSTEIDSHNFGVNNVQSNQIPIARRTCSSVVISTDSINITDNTASEVLTLPANTLLLVDSFEVVVVAADGAGGNPEIQIGPDDVTPAIYLAATPVTKTAVGGRDTFTPLVTDGVTALRVSVATAGTGTTYSVKVVARGYVVEV